MIVGRAKGDVRNEANSGTRRPGEHLREDQLFRHRHGQHRRIAARAREYLDMEPPPAATLVQAGLGTGMLLEVEAVAIVPK